MKKNTWLWTLRAIKRWIPALILLTLCYIASALFGVWFALGTQAVIDTATAGMSAAFWNACLKQGLLILAILADSTLIHHLRERITAIMDRDWKKVILHQLLRGEYMAVSEYHTGELLNRINNDVRILIGSILSIIPSVASMATKLIAAFIVLVGLEPRLTAIVVAGGILLVIVTTYMRRHLKQLNKQASQAQGKVSGFIQETLEKLLMVQAMDISDVMEERADVLLNERYKIHRKRKNISVMTSTCMSLMAYGVAFGTLVWCSHGILQGTMTFGTMTAISQLISQLQGPFTSMSGITPQFAAMSAAVERLMELEEDCEAPPVERKDPEPIYTAMTAIEAQELTFAYDRDYVFDHATFRLPKGSFGVIVGHSGIGKSTLLKLLLGIFPPQSGKLTVETENGSIPMDRSTRRLFAYVPQGNLLLSGTLRDNLLVTKQDATQEEIERAVYISAMDDYLHTLPKGLDTVMGENAAGLSEGQAQRLSIARAILSDAPILLLDEATSALDDKTERKVLSRIRELPGKTCIAVTHREAATRVADWSLEMRDGKCTVNYLNK